MRLYNFETFSVCYGPLTRYGKLRIAHAPVMPGTFSPPPTSKKTASWQSRHALRHVRHARAVMHVAIASPRWCGKRSRYSRRMCNPQFSISGKRPITNWCCETQSKYHITTSQTNISIPPLTVFEIIGQECLISLTPEVGNLSLSSVRHFLFQILSQGHHLASRKWMLLPVQSLFSKREL